MSVPPFRADHVGSLLRPAALRQAFRDHAAGRIDDAAFGALQDAAIRNAVALQEEVGLQVVNDGEFRRGSYWGRFVERLQGLAIGPARFRFRDDSGAESDFTAPIAESPLRRTVPLAADEVPTLPGPAAATSSSTRWRSPCCAIPRFASWCAATASTRRA